MTTNNKRVQLVAGLLLIFSIFFTFIIIPDSEPESKLVRLTRKQVIEQKIDQSRVIRKVGDDYLIKEER